MSAYADRQDALYEAEKMLALLSALMLRPPLEMEGPFDAGACEGLRLIIEACRSKIREACPEAIS